ncbi:MAG: MarR family transcriptional regulator [Sphingopyxis sp.]|nr:MarR family transcriptional regulator [Sphingopyxis sp.]
MQTISLQILPSARNGFAPSVNDGTAHEALPDFAQLARSILAARRQRGLYFDPGIFYDPSWEILLDLRAHHGEKRKVASLFVADFCPASTGLRHLRRLKKIGLVERWTDPSDARRRLARLSQQGLEAMDQYLATVTHQSAQLCT